MKKQIFAIIAACCCIALVVVLLTKKEEPVNDYNYRKACEVLEKDEDVAAALELLDRQIEETPDDVNALFLRLKIYKRQGAYADALIDANAALKVNKPRKSEVSNAVLWWWKACIYENINDTLKCSDAYKRAIALAKREKDGLAPSVAIQYSEYLFRLGRIEEADAIYNDILSDDETELSAVVGMARNRIETGKCGEAIALCQRSISYDSEYAPAYEFLARAYECAGEVDKSIDAVLDWVEKYEDGWDDYSSWTKRILVRHATYSVAGIRERMRSSDDKMRWHLVLVDLYEAVHDDERALQEYYVIEREFGKDKRQMLSRAECLSNLGLYKEALAEVEASLGGGRDFYSYWRMGDICRRAGWYDRAVGYFSRAIEEKPTRAVGYYARGWCRELAGDDKAALSDYEAGIDLDKSYPYIFLMRGEMLEKMGNHERAVRDFETILTLDTTAVSSSCRQYALLFLGRRQEAEDWMEKMIRKDPYESGNYYDKACLYARMGRGDEAVAALERAFKHGYAAFAHIDNDDDLDSIRGRADFKALVAKYASLSRKRLARLRASMASQESHLLSEVSVTRRSGGVLEVPCQVNGLDLKMLFDTGCSDVTISKVEADFMLKNNYLTEQDIKGKQYFQVATGDISVGTVITLREVKIGDAVLRNVNASVVKNQNAPLLLGQSVMERFGTITIDNINSKILIQQ